MEKLSAEVKKSRRGVIMFQPRFATLVELGQKTQTIRASARCLPGDPLSLREWTGKPYRSKQRVLRDVKCRRVDYIDLYENEYCSDGKRFTHEKELNKFARADGFKCWGELRAWFQKTHGLPFNGELISW